jgi:hypothetical protein
MAGLEQSGDLAGRPPFRKAVADEGPQPMIFFEDGFTPPAQLVGRGTAHAAKFRKAPGDVLPIVPKEI